MDRSEIVPDSHSQYTYSVDIDQLLLNTASFHESPIVRFRSRSADLSYTMNFQHKQDLNYIHKAFSISNVKSTPSRELPLDNSQASQTPKHYALELCMEFWWCFWCCVRIPACRKKIEENCLYDSTKSTRRRNIILDFVIALVSSPQYQNGTYKLTRTQKMMVLFRLMFELYKTMIGSFLTVFTPQNCNGQICTLTQNVIPKDNLEIVALSVNAFLATTLLFEYSVEFSREKVLRKYFRTDARLPAEKEYFSNLLGILDTTGPSIRRRLRPIRCIFTLYRQLGIVLLSLYVANIIISGAVIYKNYYDKSSLFGFVTNVLFIVLKIGKILQIAIQSIQIPYSAYIDSQVAFNSIKYDYICPEIKTHYYSGGEEPQQELDEHAQYFIEKPQFLKCLMEPNPDAIYNTNHAGIELAESDTESPNDIESFSIQNAEGVSTDNLQNTNSPVAIHRIYSNELPELNICSAPRFHSFS
jgi:hypothetical protein